MRRSRCGGTARLPSGSPTEGSGYESGLPDGWASFVVAASCQPVSPIVKVGRIAAIAVRFQGFVANDRYQKLLSHFGKAGTAVLAVKQVKYGGHDRTLV